MKKLLTLGAMTVVMAAATYSSPKADVMATVTGFVAAFNKGDTTAIAATCASTTSIIDEFAPHEWHGAGACMRWVNDWSADAARQGITDALVTLGTPTHVDLTGNVAYVVAPADYTFKMKGKSVKERGSILAIALIKTDAGWKITGWSWAKH